MANGERLEKFERLLYVGFAYHFYEAIEESKIRLSSESETPISFHRPGLDIDIPITRAEFDAHSSSTTSDCSRTPSLRHWRTPMSRPPRSSAPFRLASHRPIPLLRRHGALSLSPTATCNSVPRSPPRRGPRLLRTRNMAMNPPNDDNQWSVPTLQMKVSAAEETKRLKDNAVPFRGCGNFACEDVGAKKSVTKPPAIGRPTTSEPAPLAGIPRPPDPVSPDPQRSTQRGRSTQNRLRSLSPPPSGRNPSIHIDFGKTSKGPALYSRQAAGKAPNRAH